MTRGLHARNASTCQRTIASSEHLIRECTSRITLWCASWASEPGRTDHEEENQEADPESRCRSWPDELRSDPWWTSTIRHVSLPRDARTQRVDGCYWTCRLLRWPGSLIASWAYAGARDTALRMLRTLGLISQTSPTRAATPGHWAARPRPGESPAKAGGNPLGCGPETAR
jgi:hypothetical protein